MITANSMAALAEDSAAIYVTQRGAEVPLPTHPNMGGFGVNYEGTRFTVPATGLYLISYGVNPAVETTAASAIAINGEPNSSTTLMQLSAYGTATLQTLLRLQEGDTLSLSLYGNPQSVDLQGGVGAWLNAVRVA